MAACGGSPSSSHFQDIYWNDSETRHEATPDEIVWTVFVIKQTGSSLSFCSGAMLSERYLMTAHHCRPRRGDRYQSGSALLNGNDRDLEAIGVVESSAAKDYAVVEVRWLAGTAPSEQRFLPAVSTLATDIVTGRDGIGTELATVGFPADHNLNYGNTREPVAIYAKGYAKRQDPGYLYYNVGAINGNSGGAVWRSTDHMLVSLTNGGAHNYGQRGWNNNDPEDPNAWNFGLAFSDVYPTSRILKELYPDGKSVAVAADGRLIP